jgi:hypothetical protein
MIAPRRLLLMASLGCLGAGLIAPFREAPARSFRACDDPKARVVSGRVVDGLDRPIPAVRVVVTSRRGRAKRVEGEVRTDADGKFSCPVGEGEVDWFDAELGTEGYESASVSSKSPDQGEITLRRSLDWGEVAALSVLKGDELDRGLREVFACEADWEDGNKLAAELFREQDALRPGFRRLLKDAACGDWARDWLDRLGDPADRDVFPKGRDYAPKHEVREADLVQAIQSLAGHLNFFSKRPKPRIDIDFIAFTPDFDRALVQCGINRVAFTGITWRFVFHKTDGKWILRSMEEAGRS